MNVSSVSNLVSSLATSTKANSAIGLTVLKKAMDTQASTAAGLIQALPLPSNPNVGRNVNTIA